MKLTALLLLCASLAVALDGPDDHEGPPSDMDGKRYKCKSSTVKDDYTWTSNECTKLGRPMAYCWGAAQYYCETGDSGKDFNTDCLKRGTDCYANDC